MFKTSLKNLTKIILILFLTLHPQPVQAATCQTLHQHQVCLIDIKRSAKNYWEYRVTLTTDRPPQSPQISTEIYNCRDRHITKPDKTRVKFSTQDLSKSICRLYKPTPLPQSDTAH
jgi:hypothetical protein